MAFGSAHDHHEILPGYDPERLLQDGCAVCEARGDNPLEALVHLDAARFVKAWDRACAWQKDQLDPRHRISAAEAPMLRTLWTIQLLFERFGIAPLGRIPYPPADPESLEEMLVLHPVRVLQLNAKNDASDLNSRLTELERDAVLTACQKALGHASMHDTNAPTCGCGLSMSKNPHPDAGKPTMEGAEVGYEWECIPCIIKTRNRVGREMRKAQAEANRLQAVIRFVAESCSHANDDGQGPVHLRWEEHIHDPAVEGGHKFCGPCAAFRAWRGEPT